MRKLYRVAHAMFIKMRLKVTWLQTGGEARCMLEMLKSCCEYIGKRINCMPEVQHCSDVADAPLGKHNISGIQKHAVSSKTLV